MEPVEIIKFLADAPLALVLLWLLTKERKELSEVRATMYEYMSEQNQQMRDLVREVTSAINELTFKA